MAPIIAQPGAYPKGGVIIQTCSIHLDATPRHRLRRNATFLFLDRYGLSNNYFDRRAQDLSKVSIADMQEAVKRALSSKQMITVRVGRVGSKNPLA